LQFTFRETLGDFIANCTMSLHNVSHSMGCSAKIIQRWTIADLELEGPRDRPTALDGSMDATVFMQVQTFTIFIIYLHSPMGEEQNAKNMYMNGKI
jgi:hypothetical protein